MVSKFKALLVAGIALPALAGAAFAEGVATPTPAQANPPSVTSEAPAKAEHKVEQKKDAHKTSMVRQHHLKKDGQAKAGAAEVEKKDQIARAPVQPPKAGDAATTGKAAPKL